MDKDKIFKLLNDRLKPNDKNKKERGEVFTPFNTVNMMLDKLPLEVWKNKNLRWLEPSAGIGHFAICIYFKLMDNLEIDDEEERRRHIIENMLYMIEINLENITILQEIFNNNKYKTNIFCGDSLTTSVGTYYYDIIIGNPPYNKPLSDSPIYNQFIEYFEKKCNLLMFIVPSKWFSAGKGLNKFRKYMFNRKDIEFIYHYDDATELFGNTIDIVGGINYFLINKNYNGNCKIVLNNLKEFNISLNTYDILVPNSTYYSLIDKIQKYDSITNIYISRYYNIETNDKRLKATPEKDYIKCYVSKQKGFIQYIHKNEVMDKNIDIYKVITPHAYGSSSNKFGRIFIGTPNEVFTGSFISFKVNNKEEAESLVSYLHFSLPKFMLSLRKISQHINKETLKWIPLPPLDRIWTDNEIYKYYNLTEQEITLIEC